MSEHNHVVNKEGELALNKVDDALNRIDEERKDEILNSFNEFKSYLRKRIELAQNIGLNEEAIAVAAEKVAGYLAKQEEPRNAEEKLLRELWNAGNKEQQHALAHMLVGMAKS
ncbi:DUF3243 domain-containing protein [Paenibacillus physcomitrellae]|uniref:DUF3243 domain-containing protein n=1 Tax=Paenibacillus physcomitrellae TaxID=1619311 RepID=A0ABQ1GFI6_9BACL|nr:DUF3243 domain-containing protein [Paenibacillus physcomitrellae]GGA42618.1 hypothetical protein GCM10010917_29920 [Paenibacillus physcomitrellae]